MDAHYDALYRFLWRLTGSPDTASDLTQEAFVRALQRIGSFDGRARFSTWLHTIAINLWRDRARRMPRQATVPLEDVTEPARGPQCDQLALAHVEQLQVRSAVEQLPEAQRVAILLFYYQEMSYVEIARICGCPVGTVGSWIHHGVKALRKMMVEPVAGRRPETVRSEFAAG